MSHDMILPSTLYLLLCTYALHPLSCPRRPRKMKGPEAQDAFQYEALLSSLKTGALCGSSFRACHFASTCLLCFQELAVFSMEVFLGSLDHHIQSFIPFPMVSIGLHAEHPSGVRFYSLLHPLRICLLTYCVRVEKQYSETSLPRQCISRSASLY